MPGDYRQNYHYGGPLPAGDAQAAFAGTDRAGNQVVVKLVAARDPAAFLQQVQAAATVVHPNVARILDWGMDGQHCYVVSERVPGVDLVALAGGGTLDPRAVANVGEQVAAGLSALHERGLVHGSVGPHSIMYTPDGGVKIIDFGVRAAIGMAAAGAAGAGYPAETAPFISPEEMAGYPPSPASDQYSLGAVLYTLAGGRPPHVQAAAYAPGPGAAAAYAPGAATETPTTVMGAEAPTTVMGAAEPGSQTGPLAPITALRALAPDFPFTLESIIMRALAPHPGGRFHSMDEMRREIARTHEEAQAPSTFFEAPPEMHPEERHRKWPWIVGAIVLLAAIGVGVAYALGLFSGSELTAPNLVGKTLAEAKTTLSKDGLTLGDVSYVKGVTADTPDLVVAKQSPAAGKPIDEGGKVDVTMDAGTVKVPNVVGLTQEQANAKLQEVGLSIASVESSPSTEFEKGKVVSQVPAADSEVEAGSQVVLTISAGSETPTVPDVTGKTEAAATKKLTEAGFGVKVEEAPSETVEVGYVISQEPTGGVKAAEGTMVTITVSTGSTASPTATPTSTASGSPTSSPSP